MHANERTVFRIEVWPKQVSRRPIEGFEGLSLVEGRLYFLQGELEAEAVQRICAELLADPVVEVFSLNPQARSEAGSHRIDVNLLPGVTDPAAESLLHAAHLLGIESLERAATGQCYALYGTPDAATLQDIATRILSNPVIQHVSIDRPAEAPFVAVQAINDHVEIIALKDADDAALASVSLERRLSLDLNEMHAIRDYFAALDRDPTDAELEMLAQTWSEHCVHKTFKAHITYTGPAHGAEPDSPAQTYAVDGLLKTYLRAATEKVNKSWVRSAFVDNAGIIRFDEGWDLAFKVETHNRPSAIEPFGGANTGVGGVIRDVLGVSARPIANTDILCFGPPDLDAAHLPEGVLHPRRIARGVVAGIEDYGNKMGIPTVNGAIFYHPGYISNPLVFCGCLGILPHGAHRTRAEAGDLIVVIGGRTGRDGLRGATFSSMEMDTSTSTVSGGAVQIGHPIHEKQVQEVVLRARDEGLYTAITDCGAGGLSSAVGEMGEKIGASVQLNRVPLKYPGLQPWEIWLSEAQERMVLAVPPEHWPRVQEIAAGQDIDAVEIGTFEPTGRLTLHYGAKLVGDLSMEFLHDGIPQRHMKAEWSPVSAAAVLALPTDEKPASTLLKLLALPSIRSKEEVIRRYDHEVQGATAVKPMVGVDNHGPADASVLVPHDTQRSGSLRAAVLSNGLCPQYTESDPYAMAWAAVDEAIRNAVAVGADPDNIAILDNFSWGNTGMPDRLGSLVRCAQGCYDAALAYDVPYISGKDSLNNEYLGEDGRRHAIPGTLVISALGVIPDVRQTVTMDLKQSGSLLYLLGRTDEQELGGSHYALLHGLSGGRVPQPKPDAPQLYKALYQAIQRGMIRAAHDLSEGGLAVALAEMCIAGHLGARIDVPAGLGEVRRWLFSESCARLVVEIAPHQVEVFEALFADLPVQRLGNVISAPELRVMQAGQPELLLALAELESAWRGVPDRGISELPEHGLGTQRLSRKPASVLHRDVKAEGRKRVLILHANGTNRDRDAALACELAGGEAEIVHINQLQGGERRLLDYHMLVVPGGFSYGDDMGAGVLWAQDLRQRFKDDLDRFVLDGRPVLGICNGFQTLVKAGVLPGKAETEPRRITLTYNERHQFECRWVWLHPNVNSACLFTHGMDEAIYVPVAHGEGRVMAADEAALEALWTEGMVPLTYTDPEGKSGGYPWTPNGSMLDIAGLCNAAGNVFGLMPHPENHVFPWQHPRFHRGASGNTGLRLFENGIRFA